MSNNDEFIWVKFLPAACYIAYNLFAATRKKKDSTACREESNCVVNSIPEPKLEKKQSLEEWDYNNTQNDIDTIAVSKHLNFERLDDHENLNQKCEISSYDGGSKSKLRVKRRINKKIARKMLFSKVIFDRKYFQV